MSREVGGRVDFRPLRFVTALRVVIIALLVAFGVLPFLSFGRKEEAPVRIHLSSPAQREGEKVVDLSDNFAITGSKGGRESFRLSADQVTGFVGERKILKAVHLEVFGENGDRMRISGTTAQFDMSEKRAQLSGDVVLEGRGGFRLTTSNLYYDGERDAIFTPDEIGFEDRGMSGTGRGLNYRTQSGEFKIPSEVRIETRPPSAGEPPVRITSGDLTLALRENEVVFSDSVVMVRGAETFTGNYLKAVLNEGRSRVLSVKAYGQAAARFAVGREGAEAEIRADTLLATPGEDGTRLGRLEASGNCRLESGTKVATSESLQADVEGDRIALRGDPVVFDGRSRIAAREIDLHPAAQNLEARGDVKTTQMPAPAGEGGASFFSGRETVSFQSARLDVEAGGDVARYSGSARAWQGDDSIQAEEIVLRLADRGMKAFRNVLCRFTATEGGARGGTTPPSVIVAAAMDYSEEEGTVHFRDSVKMTRAESTIQSDRMHVALTRPEEGRRAVARVTAEGSVRFSHQSNSGAADRLVYTPSQGLAEMQQDAGLAEVADRASGRVLRGKTLTFDLRGNRILTETVEGGRAWITLNPKERDARHLESKIGN